MKTGIIMLLGWQIGMGILLAVEGPSQGVESSNPAPARLEVALHSPRYPARRPRTLLAARAARAEQAAEATRRLVINGEDSPSDATKSRAPYDPFDAYERELLSLVRLRWMHLTAQQRIPLKIGQAKVTFTLSPDGQVSDIEADAGKLGPYAGLLCVQALSDTAPFAPWTPKMRAHLGQNRRQVSLTFHSGESMPAHISDKIEEHQSRLVAHIWDGWAAHVEGAVVASQSSGNSLPLREYAGASVSESSFPAPYAPGGNSRVGQAAYTPSAYSPRSALSSTMPTRQHVIDKGPGGGVKMPK